MLRVVDHQAKVFGDALQPIRRDNQLVVVAVSPRGHSVGLDERRRVENQPAVRHHGLDRGDGAASQAIAPIAAAAPLDHLGALLVEDIK